MDKPRNGTCGECRWWDRDDGAPENSYGVCRRYPPVRWRYTNYPKTGPDWHGCGEFEPPEGRVCGTCDLYGKGVANPSELPFDLRAPFDWCPLIECPTHVYHTCPAWRWNGGAP